MCGNTRILQLDPIAFQYNGKAGTIDDDRTHYSLVAQDVMGILPDFIEKHPIDGEVFDSMSASDQSAFADGVVLGLKEGLTNFEAILIQAVKDLAEQNKALSDRVAALERQAV